MLTRKDFLHCIVLAPTLISDWHFQNQQQSDLPKGIGVEPDCTTDLPDIGALGTNPALKAEQEIAQAILAQTPVGPRPINVGEFFIDVSKGKYGKEWQPYAQGWPVRWNPLIVTFFRATATVPEGDITSWCAAFVNWCFQQAGKGFATASASSGSFRTFGTPTTTPRQGDIVVFRQTDAGEAAKGRGHVGFFVEQRADAVNVLGGNQIDRNHPGSHIISSKWIPKRSKLLALHSFRTDPRLH